VASSPQSTTTQQLNAQTYTVQEGDTLWSIVRKFQGLSIETLRDLNNLKDNKIYPGQVLVLAR
jgi:membrane-bound lytic murein transglycosylase D